MCCVRNFKSQMYIELLDQYISVKFLVLHSLLHLYIYNRLNSKLWIFDEIVVGADDTVHFAFTIIHRLSQLTTTRNINNNTTQSSAQNQCVVCVLVFNRLTHRNFGHCRHQFKWFVIKIKFIRGWSSLVNNPTTITAATLQRAMLATETAYKSRCGIGNSFFKSARVDWHLMERTPYHLWDSMREEKKTTERRYNGYVTNTETNHDVALHQLIKMSVAWWNHQRIG